MIKLGKGKILIIVLVVAFFAYVVFGPKEAVGFRGGWLDIAQPQDADILDPARTVFPMATRVIALIYEPLLTYDYDMNLIPMLAESWDYNEEARFYEFKLKRGIIFHDGYPFTAEAVENTIDRIKTIRGTKHRESVKNIQGVVVDPEDNYTVRVYLREEDRYLIDWFASVSSVIVSPLSAGKYGEDFGTSEGPPAGTGPFKFKRWVSGDKIELERFENYNWGPERYLNRGPAYIEGVTFHIVTADLPRETWLERGDVDFVTTVRKTSALINSWTEDPNIELINQGGNSLVYLGFNNAGTDNHGYGTLSSKSVPKKVRQAIAYAIDENEIIDLALAGAGALPNSWLADSVWSSAGYQEQMYPHDLEKARQLMAEAGYGEGLSLELIYSGDPTYRDAASILERQLNKIGITLTIEEMEFTALEAKITDKNYNMFMMGYTWPLADIIWWEWHTVRLPSPNRFWWGDDYTDAIIMDTFSMDDDVAREALQESQRLIAEDAASIALWQRPVLMAYRKDSVKGFEMHPLADMVWHFLDTYILQLEKPQAVSVSTFPSENSGPAGSELIYTVIVVNMGTEADNYMLEVSDNAGWSLTLSDNMLEIPSGGTEPTNLIVAIPEGATAGIQDEIIVNVTSRADETVTDSVSCIANTVAP